MNEKSKFQSSVLRKVWSLALFCSFSIALMAQQKSISGIVSSSDSKEGLIGVTVMVKGASNGTVTDIDGKYSITVPGNDAVLVFTMLGMKKEEVKVGNNSTINIKLASDSQLMEEVVVTGYTSQKKADLTGAVSVVKVADMKDAPYANVLQALEGHAAGVQINTDGTPGGGATTITIRGVGTINDVTPLYIIDGVPTNDMSGINTNDIASLQVLKDASSSSIYGARAANGVIIITTKKGGNKPLSVEVNVSSGLQTVAKDFSVLNATQWGQVYWQAAKNTGLSPNVPAIFASGATPVPLQYINGNQNVPFTNTDWQKAIYSSVWMQNYGVTLSNGNDKGNMMFSMNYVNQKGIMDYTYYKRYTARLNSAYNISKYVSIGENVMLSHWNNIGANTQSDRGEPYTAMRSNPAIPVRDLKGNFTNPLALTSSDIGNPVQMLYNARNNQNQNWRILGNTYIEIKPLAGLSIKSNLGIEHIQYFNHDMNLKMVSSDVNSVINSYGQGDTWTWTNTATYELKKGQNELNLLAGSEAINYGSGQFSAMRLNYAFQDPNYMVLDAGSGTQTNGGNQSDWSLFSLFGKADYNYNNTYLLSATIRRDASSRLGKTNNSGIFPAFSGAWRITEEPFMPKIDGLDYLKFRAGWGQTGNSSIGNYATYSNYAYNVGNGAYPLNGTNSSTTGIIISGTGNTNLKWETTTQLNLGFDAAFFKNALNISFDYYNKRTTNMLTIPPTLSVLGENASTWMNTGTMSNKGYELVMDYNSKKTGDFSWGASFNLAHYKNELVALNSSVTETGGDQRNIVGQPIGVFYGYVADGIFKTADQVLNHATQPGAAPGRIMYRDLNHDGVINSLDQTVIGDPNPSLIMGLNLRVSYKNFTLSSLISSELGFNIYNTTKRELDFMTYDNVYDNRGTATLNAWTPTNTNASVPALSLLDNNNEMRTSTYFMEDGSYVQMKNLKLSYKFMLIPAIQKMGIKSFDLFGQVDNVFTITKYSGLSPVISASGIDNGTYPIPRTFTIGLHANF